MNIDYGLSVTYDGKTYTLMDPDCLREYPIGGMISEYCRLAPTEIKQVSPGPYCSTRISRPLVFSLA